MTIKKPAPKTDTAAKQTGAAKLAYEQKRAAKAGQSHAEWLKAKAKAEAEAAKKEKPKPVKKPNLISRLLDKAHKPI